MKAGRLVRGRRRAWGGVVLLLLPCTAAVAGPFVVDADIPSGGMPYAGGGRTGTLSARTRWAVMSWP